MKIEDHLPSLNTCKKMKELGWEKPTLFQWYQDWKDNWHVSQLQAQETWNYMMAPLASEILEELPYDFDYPNENKNYLREDFQESSDIYVCWYRGSNWPHGRGSTEAEARAKMWIYLKENKLI